MKHSTWALLLLLPFASVSACPPGEWLQQGPGWQMCVPMPGMSRGSEPPTDVTRAKVSHWGAIAIDRVDGGAGIGASTNMSSKKEAQKIALADCKRKGGTRCDIEIAYVNQCSAIIWGDRALNSSTAATKSEAERRGLDKCSRSGDTGCEVYYSACSLTGGVN